MSKPFYKHHYAKVTVPVFIPLYDLADYLCEEDADALERMGFSGAKVTLTVRRDPEDKEDGIPVSYSIDDVDVDDTNMHCLYEDNIIRACEDFVATNEEDYLADERVKDAFHWFDEKAA